MTTPVYMNGHLIGSAEQVGDKMEITLNENMMTPVIMEGLIRAGLYPSKFEPGGISQCDGPVGQVTIEYDNECHGPDCLS